MIFSSLPEIIKYQLDVEKLNKEHGEFNWRIVRWNETEKLNIPK